jgi:hypothetical protein
MNESEVAKECDKLLEAAGWMVVKTSVDRKTRKQLSGLPDRVCFRQNMTFLVEYKAEGGDLRGSQWEFLRQLGPHMGTKLRYKVVAHPDALPRWAVE